MYRSNEKLRGDLISKGIYIHDFDEDCLMEHRTDHDVSCGDSYAALKSCSQPICDRCDGENTDTRLPFAKPILSSWLANETKNVWGNSMYDKEKIPNRERAEDPNFPRTAEEIHKSGW